MIFTGSGVASVDQGPPLHAIHLYGGITGSSVIPVTDPNVTGMVKSFRVEASLGTGALSPFSPIATPQLTNNSLPLNGGLRVCLFTAGCDTSYRIPFATSQGEKGVGIGGLWTLGGYGTVRISIESAPWTFLTVEMNGTWEGDPWTFVPSGFIHGPYSFEGSAGATGGLIQLVAPVYITGGFEAVGVVTQTLRFVPEPEFLLLIGAGVAGLLLIGRGRIRSHGRKVL